MALYPRLHGAAMRDKIAPILLAVAIFSFGVFAGEWVQDFIVLNSSTEHPLELTGDATVWEDLKAPAQTAVAIPGRVPAEVAYKTDFIVLDFDYQGVANNEKAAAWWLQTPHRRKSGTDLDLHVHWIPENNNACTVRWCAVVMCESIGGTFTSGVTSCANEAINNNQDLHILTDIADVDGSSLGISSMCGVRLYRNSSNAADDCSSTSAYLTELDMHYQIDTLGSREEGSK